MEIAELLHYLKIIESSKILPKSEKTVLTYIIAAYIKGLTEVPLVILKTNIPAKESTLYHALKKLTKDGLVVKTKKETKYYYSLAPQGLESLKTKHSKINSIAPEEIEKLLQICRNSFELEKN